jgi:hypothetical protein
LARLLDSVQKGGLQSLAEQPKSESAKVVDIAEIDRLSNEVRRFAPIREYAKLKANELRVRLWHLADILFSIYEYTP